MVVSQLADRELVAVEWLVVVGGEDEHVECVVLIITRLEDTSARISKRLTRLKINCWEMEGSRSEIFEASLKLLKSM